MIDLASLSRGFRKAYLDHAAITAQLRAWATAYPAFVSLREIGRTREHREIWMLVIGTSPDDARPGVWVDGNMHAAEVAGSSVALAIAESVIAIHIELANGSGASHAHSTDLPLHLKRAVQGTLFYVVPRISPDGAETVLATGRFVRSTPVEDRHERGAPWWRALDLNGDGFIGRMRVPHPDGELVESPERPGLMLPREIEHAGPFYKVYPEGVIENFDGDTIPTPGFLSRQLPRSQPQLPLPLGAASPHQLGAGDYPGSEPEARAVIESASRAAEHLRVAEPAHVRRLLHPPAR
jgi:hypothetical protein